MFALNTMKICSVSYLDCISISHAQSSLHLPCKQPQIVKAESINRSCPIGWMQIYMCSFTNARIEVKLKVEQFKVACMFVQFISRAAETFEQSKISGERKAVNENEKKSTSSEIDRLLPYMYF